MSESSHAAETKSTVRRHVIVSVAAGAVTVGLAVFGGLPAGAVVAISLVVAATVCGVAMHAFSEKPAIQLLTGFTVFFVFMMVMLFRLGISDKIHGTQQGTYDSAPAVEESH